MGEIAEDMVDGACCSQCNIYFEREHGYPVLCKGCWEELPPANRDGYSLATEEEV